MPTNMSRLFAELMERFTDDEPLAQTVFAAGFVTGQAEKVCCGACKAAMFRPETPAHDEMLGEIIKDIADKYGLFWDRYLFQGEVEYWIATTTWWFLVDRMTDLGETGCNTPAWHMHRALLCGVDPQQIDLEYHKGKG